MGEKFCSEKFTCPLQFDVLCYGLLIPSNFKISTIIRDDMEANPILQSHSNPPSGEQYIPPSFLMQKIADTAS